MVSRRKTKTERELVADIHKTFDKFCVKHECISCPYAKCEDCKIEYLKDLLSIVEDWYLGGLLWV